MKTIITTLLIICVFPQFLFSTLHIDTIYLYTAEQTPDSSHVYLVEEVIYPSSPCQLENISIADTLDQITVKLCTLEGWADSRCTRRDTVDLGKRANEILNIRLMFFYGGQNCPDTQVVDTKYIQFSTEYNSINTIQNKARGIKIYPNPATNSSIIEVSSNCPSKSKLLLFDIRGQLKEKIYEGFLDSAGKKITLQTQDLRNGVYFISLRNACESKTLKLIKF